MGFAGFDNVIIRQVGGKKVAINLDKEENMRKEGWIVRGTGSVEYVGVKEADKVQAKHDKYWKDWENWGREELIKQNAT